MSLQPSTADIGQRLIPVMVDWLAQHDPHRVIYSVARSQQVSDGFLDISARTLARAVDRCSWHLESLLGRGQNFPTIAYMGPQDVLYSIFTLAGIKTGYKAFLDSARNSLQAHVHLFEQTQCNTLCVPPNFSPPFLKDLAAADIRVIEIPGVHHWLEDGHDDHDQPYAYEKTYADAESDPIAVLHTSGSTGMPKPVVQTHGSHAPLDAFAALQSKGYKPTFPAMCAGTRVYLGVPLFHAAGFSIFLAGCIYNGFTIVLGPFPPTADTANAVHTHGNVQNSILPPWTLIEISRNPDYLENLCLLQHVIFGGGLLPLAVGDLVSTKTRLLNCLGSTECGTFPAQLCSPEDWAYLSLSPVLGYEYRPVSEDLYEQVIVRDPTLQQYQGVFKTFPHLDEWPMKDLYSRHPTNNDLWLYKGRADDIIVFSNGEKFNPVDMEAKICAHPEVNTAIVAGSGNFQSSLLIETTKPPDNKAEREHLLEAIWPSVDDANKQCPSHGRVHRHMIIFTTRDKPLPRASKGTVQRRPALELYSTELKALYTADNLTADPASVDECDNVDFAVRHAIKSSTDIRVDEINADADLFELGVDSLQVTLITRQLNKWLSTRNREPLTSKTIYQHPSIAALVMVLSDLYKKEPAVRANESREETLQKLYNFHSARISSSTRPVEPQSPGRFVVLLTGSTGSLGSYILDSLLQDTRVSQVYCLSRGPRGADRLKASLAAKGLQPLSEKVSCIDADLSKHLFGLSRADYKRLTNEVTTVIHNAWQVDFNLSVHSFGSQLSAVRRLIDFSIHSRFGAKVQFISSISTVANWHTTTGQAGKVPERIYEGWGIPHPIGYAESKFIAERLFNTAAEEEHVPTLICRVSQIAGPTTTAGVWPKHEWLPSLIASSKYLAKLPGSLGRHEILDWIPVDTAAQTIVEIVTGTSEVQDAESPSATVCHIANPHHTTWGRLLPSVKQYLDPMGNIEIVSLKEWVDALRHSGTQTDEIANNPATKLLDFFDGLILQDCEPTLLSTERSLSSSPTLSKLEAVQDSWVKNWITQWKF